MAYVYFIYTPIFNIIKAKLTEQPIFTLFNTYIYIYRVVYNMYRVFLEFSNKLPRETDILSYFKRLLTVLGKLVVDISLKSRRKSVLSRLKTSDSFSRV